MENDDQVSPQGLQQAEQQQNDYKNLYHSIKMEYEVLKEYKNNIINKTLEHKNYIIG